MVRTYQQGHHALTVTSVPLVNCMELQLRFLSPQDIDQVKVLCRDWFPIEYPDTWYQEITSNPRFFSLAATLNGTIIGLIVAETKELGQLAKEDRSLLASCFMSGTKVGYILSLGVTQQFRKQGIASILLDQLISHLTSEQYSQVKALYLHVLTTNTQAITFYEHRGFQVHSFLPYYYAIKGKRKDGFTHVLYLNGGHPTWGALDYVKLAALALCSLSPHRAVARLCSWLATMPRLRRIAHSSQAVFS
eukprot:TRINITY_DN3991_c0_g1_i1.p1 TRINITY_DN3991_c0_g1~~TRINITY_DN3991_c0_g1_i1.p1  ORF type:complete len:248 (-),score=72.00 TRINITY_DN3991_c0_g1_i1:113-856(-)